MSLSTFRRWVTENLPDESARSKVTVLRGEVEPGSEAWVLKLVATSVIMMGVLMATPLR